jgi:hypothetical protein
VNARLCHPLMEGYKFTSFCCVVSVTADAVSP